MPQPRTVKIVSSTRPKDGRTENQDRFAILENHGGVVLCDGLGGHPGGEIAARLACKTIEDWFNRFYKYSIVTDSLKGILETTHQLITARGEELGKKGMSTTATICLVDPSTINYSDITCYYGQIGDTRLYQWRQDVQELKLITPDDSLPIQMAAAVGQEQKMIHFLDTVTDYKKLSHSQLLAVKGQSLLTQALGLSTKLQFLHPHTDLFTVDSRDWIVLCSDGVYTNLKSWGMSDILLKNDDPQIAAEQLISEAYSASHSLKDWADQDDMTVVIISFEM